MSQIQSRNSSYSLQIAILVAIFSSLFVGFLSFNFLNNSFFDGAYLQDTGWRAYLTFQSTPFLNEPSSIRPGYSHYTDHVSPIYFLFSLPSHFLPVEIFDNYSLILGLQAALIVFAGCIAVLTLNLNLPPLLTAIVASLAGVALYFSQVNMICMSYQHMEPFFAPFAILFFVAYATRKYIISIIFFVLLLLTREEMGFQIFGLLVILIIYERLFGEFNKQNLNQLFIFATIAFIYSVVTVITQQYFDTDSRFVNKFVGDPPLAHLTISSLISRFGDLAKHRIDLVLGVISVTALALHYRRPQYVFGYVAFFPWLALNVSSVGDESATRLLLHHGYPFVLAQFWPIIYENLSLRCEPSGSRSGPIAATNEVDGPNSIANWSRRPFIVVSIVTLTCIATVFLPQYPRWILSSMHIPDLEKRQATQLLGALIDRGSIEKLDLRVSPSVAAVRPGAFLPKDIVFEVDQDRPKPKGVLYYSSEIDAGSVIGFAIRNKLQNSLRFGQSNLHVAFDNESSDQISKALESVNVYALRFDDRRFLYQRLRVGNSGRLAAGEIGTGSPAIKGLVAFGPYIRLGEGEYRLSYRLALKDYDARDDKKILKVRIEAIAGLGNIPIREKVFAGDQIDVSDPDHVVEFSLQFQLEEDMEPQTLEFRVWNLGSQEFTIQDIVLESIEE